jgi:purine-binding chemotaxis protein CheW
MTASAQYCTFFLDRHFLGVEVETVQEVLRYQKITRVPLGPRVAEGLMNLRGQIVTAIDLRKRLEMPERAADVQPVNLVVRTKGGVISLLVDEIGDVLDVPADLFEAPPETLKGSLRDLIRGSFKLKDRLLLALNAEEAVKVSGKIGSDVQKQ